MPLVQVGLLLHLQVFHLPLAKVRNNPCSYGVSQYIDCCAESAKKDSNIPINASKSSYLSNSQSTESMRETASLGRPAVSSTMSMVTNPA